MEGKERRDGYRRTYRTSAAYHKRNRMAASRLHRTGYGRKRRAGGRSLKKGGSGLRSGKEGNRWGKLLTILISAAFLFFLLITAARKILLPGPEGEYLAIQEAENLTLLLSDLQSSEEAFGQPDTKADIFTKEAASEDGYLTFEAWERIAALFPECGYELPDGYRKKDTVLLSDWYEFFDAALAVYDTQGQVQDVALTPIGIGEAVTDAEGEALAQNGLISENSAYTFLTDRIRDLLYRPVTAVCRDGCLYAVRSVDGREGILSNIWILEAGEDSILGFWNDYEIRFPVSGGGRQPDEAGQPDGTGQPDEAKASGTAGEQVADLYFLDGVLQEIRTKTQKISGKILRVENDGVEVEGSGFLPFADTFRVYRLYGKLKSYETQDLRIGYDFTDFVIDDGCVQAALVVKEETMENIRVLVKTTGFAGVYHEAVSLTADCDLSVITGEYGNQETTVIPAGETLTIDKKSGLFAADGSAAASTGSTGDAGDSSTGEASPIIRIEPAVLTGRIRLLSVERSQGTPSYRGSLELRLQEEGILVVNELLLEEYLYAVVPSEMPASYPLEALKAQAVCARTYAYARILHAGLPEYGAHVDDSTSYQVYNNILENAQTTKAVRETKGELLYYGEELADTYYYSTSCGYGTDAGVWSGSGPDAFPYLQGKAVNVAGVVDAQGDAIDETVNEADIAAADFMMQEESFAAFIKNVRLSDFESGEAWYRWTYQVDELDAALLYERVLERCAAAPSTVSVLREDGAWENQTPPDPGRILGLSITERSTGGVAQALQIVGESATILVRTEHSIRYVLCDARISVIRQDGSAWQPSSLLPSGFFVLETAAEDGYVTGFTLYGGGFGHGVGLSQNGAKEMAESGCDCETILSYFYEGISLKKGNAL